MILKFLIKNRGHYSYHPRNLSLLTLLMCDHSHRLSNHQVWCVLHRRFVPHPALTFFCDFLSVKSLDSLCNNQKRQEGTALQLLFGPYSELACLSLVQRTQTSTVFPYWAQHTWHFPYWDLNLGTMLPRVTLLHPRQAFSNISLCASWNHLMFNMF